MAVLAAAIGAQAQSPWKQEEFVTAPKFFPAPEAPVDGLKAIYFEGPRYGGKPTRVFAYYAVPEGASAAKKVPGIVLVHGGGGTAYANWVKLWASRGYAAIAFDHFGGIPIKSSAGWQRNPGGGPGADVGGAIDSPPENQWMYHAVADTMLAHSLLASLPEVDGSRIGVTGISWGAVVTAIVSGLDHRFRFAVPVYGCGFISDVADDGSQFVGDKLPEQQRAKWRALWDPANYLGQSRLPMLWLTGTNDFAFTLRVWQQSIHEAKGPQSLGIRLRMTHSHGAPGESPEEIRIFADSVVNGGKPLAKITATGVEGEKAWAKFESTVPVVRAELLYTRYTGVWQNRKWEMAPLDLTTGANESVSIELPKGTKAWFFNIIDERGAIVSSDPILAPVKSASTP